MSKTHCIYYRSNVEPTQRDAKAGDDPEASRLLPEEESTKGPSNRMKKTTREKNRGGNAIYGSIRFLRPLPRFGSPT